jgi:hypothetical protein
MFEDAPIHYYTPEESDFLVDVWDHETREVWDRLTAADVVHAGLLRGPEDEPVFIDLILDAKGLVEWNDDDDTD